MFDEQVKYLARLPLSENTRKIHTEAKPLFMYKDRLEVKTLCVGSLENQTKNSLQ